MAYDYNSRMKWEAAKLEEWDKGHQKEIGKWSRKVARGTAGERTLREILYAGCPEIIDILVPSQYRDDFDYMLDQYTAFQYTRSLFRPTVRTADPEAHMADAFGLMQAYKVLGIYGVTPLEYLTERQAEADGT